MDPALRSLFIETLGPDGVAEGDAVLPATPEQMRSVCAACARTGTAMTVISGPDAAELAVVRGILVSLARMTGVTIDAAAGIAHAQAGAVLPAVRSAAQQQGLAVVGMRAGGPEHVGSAIARGTIAARGLVGIDLVSSTGTRITAGGRTLAGVTGYDLAGLILGSMGVLAVIVGAGFRLAPIGAEMAAGSPPGPAAGHPLMEALRQAMDPGRRLDPVH